jgi:hypothetical protein
LQSSAPDIAKLLEAISTLSRENFHAERKKLANAPTILLSSTEILQDRSSIGDTFDRVERRVVRWNE